MATTGMLSLVLSVVSVMLMQLLFQRPVQSFRIVAMVVAIAVFYMTLRPTFEFVTTNFRDCSTYYRFKRLFRYEFGKKDVGREEAIRNAEERLHERRGRYTQSRNGFGVQQDVGNGMRLSFGNFN